MKKNILWFSLIIIATNCIAAVKLNIISSNIQPSMNRVGLYLVSVIIYNISSTTTNSTFIVITTINSTNSWSGSQTYLRQFNVNGLTVGTPLTLISSIINNQKFPIVTFNTLPNLISNNYSIRSYHIRLLLENRLQQISAIGNGGALPRQKYYGLIKNGNI